MKFIKSSWPTRKSVLVSCVGLMFSGSLFAQGETTSEAGTHQADQWQKQWGNLEEGSAGPPILKVEGLSAQSYEGIFRGLDLSHRIVVDVDVDFPSRSVARVHCFLTPSTRGLELIDPGFGGQNPRLLYLANTNLLSELRQNVGMRVAVAPNERDCLAFSFRSDPKRNDVKEQTLSTAGKQWLTPNTYWTSVGSGNVSVELSFRAGGMAYYISLPRANPDNPTDKFEGIWRIEGDVLRVEFADLELELRSSGNRLVGEETWQITDPSGTPTTYTTKFVGVRLIGGGVGPKWQEHASE